MNYTVIEDWWPQKSGTNHAAHNKLEFTFLSFKIDLLIFDELFCWTLTEVQKTNMSSMVHDVPVHPRCGASNILHSDFNFIGYYLNKNSYSHKVDHMSAKWPNNQAHYESVYYLPVFNRFHHITQWKKSTDTLQQKITLSCDVPIVFPLVNGC